MTMNKLPHLITKARKGLSPWESLPDSAIVKIARKCGRDEVAYAHIRIKELRAERIMVEDWDGDTQDDIWRAITFFEKILLLSRG
ncbi:conserved hypothetical protein [Enterobacterales bacterium 8AC]|nr:conserved hypothetical protein [Enterobacterales bacterium 8AC]